MQGGDLAGAVEDLLSVEKKTRVVSCSAYSLLTYYTHTVMSNVTLCARCNRSLTAGVHWNDADQFTTAGRRCVRHFQSCGRDSEAVL